MDSAGSRADSNNLGDNWLMIDRSEAVVSGLRRHSSLRTAVVEESLMQSPASMRRSSLVPLAPGPGLTAALRDALQVASSDTLVTLSAPAASNPLATAAAAAATRPRAGRPSTPPGDDMIATAV
jgi:hypothetical protein